MLINPSVSTLLPAVSSGSNLNYLIASQTVLSPLVVSQNVIIGMLPTFFFLHKCHTGNGAFITKKKRDHSYSPIAPFDFVYLHSFNNLPLKTNLFYVGHSV